MTAKYYIQIYRLSAPDGGDILESVGDTDALSETEVMSTYAERWIHEIRPQSQNEAQCRAVMYRTLLEGLLETPLPPGCSPLVPYAWAHLMTDAIHQGVCKRDLTARN